MKNTDLAAILERKGAESGEYPPDWPEIAQWVKTIAGWRCERCLMPHESRFRGFTLTVHHLDGIKDNCELWNLVALCQRCHLSVQTRVEFYHIPEVYDWETNTYKQLTSHTRWLARHIDSYNVWAFLNDRPQIPISRRYEKDYSRQWPKVEAERESSPRLEP